MRRLTRVTGGLHGRTLDWWGSSPDAHPVSCRVGSNKENSMKRNPHHTKKGPGRTHRDGRAYRNQRASQEPKGWFDGMAGRFRSALGL